ncbi:MAG: DUF4252 domain-containing protein [Xanthomonadales bacterium]|nr:DUF4252 domain-containing protein [Xanthomonadales bacterium]
MTTRPAPAAALTLALSLALSLTISACGLTAPRGEPGYADLESLGVWDTDRQMALSIGPTLLRFAARHVDDEPEIQALLRSLDGVRIRIYEIDGSAARVASRMDRMQSHLEDDGWQPVMLVRQGQERTQLLLKTSHGVTHGLTLLTSDGEHEAVVINLIGDIEPRYFADVMVALDIEEGGAQGVQVAESTSKASVRDHL